MEQQRHDVSIVWKGKTYGGSWWITGSRKHPTLNVSYMGMNKATGSSPATDEGIAQIMLRELVEEWERRFPGV